MPRLHTPGLLQCLLVIAGMLATMGSSSAKPAAAAAVAATGRVTVEPAAAAGGSLSSRAEGALWGLFIGDALSMPVHWYYDARAIPRDYGGRIVDFHAAKEPHPSSIMSLSNTGGAGRGGQSGSIIGDVINHGKKHLWGPRGVHYHHGMAAGDNTLNAVVARVVMRAYTTAGAADTQQFLEDYVAFMTTPGSHRDTYAESYHRMFFANWAQKLPLDQCADDDHHNIASMGGLVNLPPAIVFTTARAHSEGREAADVVSAAGEAAVAQMYTTHNSKALAAYAQVYGELVSEVLLGADLRTAVAAAGKAVGVDVAELAGAGHADTDVIGRLFSSACYIEHSFPCLLYLAYKYAGDPEAALVANTNAGGENVHRGAALGALMGAAHGVQGWPSRWRKGLLEGPAIEAEVGALLQAANKQGGVSAGAAAAAESAAPDAAAAAAAKAEPDA